ncbi:MAG: cysteine-rich CWC family protein [Pseudomonadaceae bacterium]|nr:cysteine-rich CWC family protein [Pseudomonadaceae bacterium]
MQCPRCGQSNQCTLANPQTAAQVCWCFNISIDPALLAALPAAQRNVACLCPACAQATTPTAPQN